LSYLFHLIPIKLFIVMALFKSTDKYLLRVPAKPVNALYDLHSGVGYEEYKAILSNVFSTDEMKEAIFITSPELYDAMLSWLNGNLKDKVQEKKLLQSLHKYYCRMSTRCTPYGLFAGCSIGKINDEPSSINLTEKKTKRHVRIDMNYVGEITNYLNSVPEIIFQLNYFPNDSLYKVGNKYRLIDYTIRNKFRSYKLSSLSESKYLNFVLNYAKEGQKISAIIDALVVFGVNHSDAERYVSKLITSQVLISELYPTVTGDEFFEVLVKHLKGLNHTEIYVQALEEIKGILSRQDYKIDKYFQVRDIFQRFIPTELKNLVQVDSFYEPKTNTINTQIIDEIVAQSEVLLQIGDIAKRENLEDFKRKFTEKFDLNEVPLFQALDLEMGVGYGAKEGSDNLPLLDEVGFVNKRKEVSTEWNKTNNLILKKYKEFLKSKNEIIEITDEDLESIKDKSNPINTAASSFLFCSILSKSSEELDKGNYQFSLIGFGGPSAGNLLGRFSHGNSELSDLLNECLSEEQSLYGDTILAEIAHLPEARLGNVLMRPNFRKYEIPFLGKSSVDKSHQILVEDLMVSVKNNRVILRSKRLNKEVIPRLTNAHNFVLGLPIYRFLCDLQTQGLSRIFFWNWPSFTNDAYLPRVQYKKLIMSRARWVFKKKNFPQLNDKNLSIPEFINELRIIYKLPETILLSDADNELLIDFRSYESAEILVQALRKRDIIMYENLSGFDNCFVDDENGKFTNEFIIPLKATNPYIPKSHFKSDKSIGLLNPKRSFIPGSEWLFVKIYAGNISLDNILKIDLKPIIESLIVEGVIKKWFFIRYVDPEPHIRLRFYNEENPDFWFIVLQRLNKQLQALIETGVIHKITTDTYVRELERYGIDTIHFSEDIFFRDSNAILNFIELLEGEEGEKYRWLFALKNIDTLLDDFDYKINEKYDLAYNLQAAFYEELDIRKNNILLYNLNTKYREYTKEIEAILSPINNNHDLLDAYNCFTERTYYNKSIIKNLSDCIETNPNHSNSLETLLISYIHMTLNRTFVALPRKQELVIYHFLMKFYESQIARSRAKKKTMVLELN
jgi:lantibiotic biosynthesis protein